MSVQHELARQPVAVIFAGAYELPERIRPADTFNLMAYAGAQLTSSRYRNVASKILGKGVQLRNALVIPNMGVPANIMPTPINRSYEQIYEEAAADFEKTLALLGNPSGGLHFFGLSLGGNIANMISVDNKHVLKVDSVNTFGTPYDGIEPMWDGLYTHLNPELRQTSKQVAKRRAALGNLAPELNAFAGEHDEIVKKNSALPAMADTRTVLRGPDSTSHWDLMSHRETLAFCGNVMRSALGPVPTLPEINAVVIPIRG